MNDLEAKLDYILKSNAAVQRYFDKDSEADYDKLIPAIKQAFQNGGYVNKYEHTFSVEMTGQEWYERFSNELKSLISRGDGETWMGWGCGEVRAAAKKAAGL